MNHLGNALETECPETHPHQIFEDVWPGTTHACDCLENSKDREYDLDTDCKEKYKQKDKKQPSDCIDLPAIHPIVLN